MKSSLQPGERIRVMVVDDSVVIRRLVTSVLEQDPEVEIVGTAANGLIGLHRLHQWNPHIITLDVEMPQMNGLEMLRIVRKEYPSVRVLMFSTLTERGATVTLEALSLGADDYIAKPTGLRSLEASRRYLQSEMLPKIKQFFPRSLSACPPNSLTVKKTAESNRAVGTMPVAPVKPEVVVLGISTGGPAALSTILPLLPADFAVPMLIVQHMPPVFTRLLADRLNAICPLAVREAADGDLVQGGTVFVAPGDFHMKVRADHGRVWISLDQAPQENFCRPAADVLFRSAAEIYGSAVLPVVLTGMGQDGLRGVEVLKAHGARILVQNEATSTVWGMPGAVVRGGMADAILPIDMIAPEIVRICTGR